MSRVKLRWIAVIVGWTVAVLPAVGSAATQPTAPEPPKADEAAEKVIAESAARADRLLEQGKFAEAAGPAREAANLTARAYGPRHWRAFDADRRLRLAEVARDGPADQRQRLAEALGAEAQARGLERSKPAEAEKLALRAAEGYASALGEQAPEHARTWHLVGRLRLARNDAKGAKAANQKALAIRRKALPEGHPDIARSLNNLGLAQAALRDYAGARASSRAGPGYLPPGPAPGPPRHRRQPAQPGECAVRAAGLRGGAGELRAGPGHPPQGPAPGPPRHRREPEQPGARAGRAAGLRGGAGEPRAGPGHPPQGPAPGPPRHRQEPEQPGE